MRLSLSVLALIAFGWALVTCAEARHRPAAAAVETRIQIVEVQPEPAVWADTPIADSLVDWANVEKDEACLWDLLQEHNIEITLRNVWAVGIWADLNGGACHLIGEDDE